VSQHLREGLLAVFVGGPILYDVQRVDVAFPLSTSVALKIDKNELKATKLQHPEVGRIVFTENSLSNSS